MADIYLYNSMTNKKEVFVPRENDNVSVFTCGPSIYQKPHIGNYRTFIYEDALVRVLELYGYTVKRVMNLTDIEDKTISEARKQHRDFNKVTREVYEYFLKNAERLELKMPDIAPATQYVDSVVRIIKELEKKGVAYRHGGDIFFRPKRFEGFGKLYGLDMSQWPEKTVRFRRDTYTGNRWNRGDFVLWHGYQNEDRNAFWDTEIGKGRPSWNVQDPSIVLEHFDGTVDINCGGIDNIYRHHDYNIAIIESMTGKTYANYYMHGEHLIVRGQKMSKSKGNTLFVEDIINNGYDARELRFFLLYNHYRKKLNFTDERFAAQAALCRQLRRYLKQLADPQINKKAPEVTDAVSSAKSTFVKHIGDDLGIKQAVDSFMQDARSLAGVVSKNGVNQPDAAGLKQLVTAVDSVLRIL